MHITIILSLLVLLVLLLPIAGKMMEQSTGHAAGLVEVVTANATLAVLWPTLNCLLILYLSTVVNHKTRFFNHHIWQVSSKLVLSIFLIHWEILSVIYTKSEAPPLGYWSELWVTTTFAIVWSIILAIILHILFEVPMTALLSKAVGFGNTVNLITQVSLKSRDKIRG